MSANTPELLDAWRMVAAHRCFNGWIALASMSRLRDSLADTAGGCAYTVRFGRDEVLRVAYAELSADAVLPLQCQRSLERFAFPVQIRQRLGLIRSETEEVALPPDYEAFLVPEDGMLRVADMVEDELVLALPLVPVAPCSERVDSVWGAPADEENMDSPFAVLAALKKQ